MPDPNNPQTFNRYTYALNNPLRYTDPTGNYPDDLNFDLRGGFSNGGRFDSSFYQINPSYLSNTSTAAINPTFFPQANGLTTFGANPFGSETGNVPFSIFKLPTFEHNDPNLHPLFQGRAQGEFLESEINRLTQTGLLIGGFTSSIRMGVRSAIDMLVQREIAATSELNGFRQAINLLREAGYSRDAQIKILQSFQIETIRTGIAGPNLFGIRYFGGEAKPVGGTLFDTFPASRQSLALLPEWNAMTGFQQFQIRPGAEFIYGRAASQGFGFEGGQLQRFIPNFKTDLLFP